LRKTTWGTGRDATGNAIHRNPADAQASKAVLRSSRTASGLGAILHCGTARPDTIWPEPIDTFRPGFTINSVIGPPSGLSGSSITDRDGPPAGQQDRQAIAEPSEMHCHCPATTPVRSIPGWHDSAQTAIVEAKRRRHCRHGRLRARASAFNGTGLGVSQTLTLRSLNDVTVVGTLTKPDRFMTGCPRNRMPA
jgi:hypothetical protein